ncbi:MAG: DUF2520 domain-containing protein [Firmicutes bacterium]|nr:DUF2520 domain-containing protein [Bacillota bacterium]
MNTRIGIIGAGVVGTAMGVILNAKGYEITGVYDKNPESTHQLVEQSGCTVYADPQDVARTADILFITTGDTEIQGVAENLAAAQAFHSGQIVVHLSGALTSEILDRAKEYGALVLSVHPLQSFVNLAGAVANLPGSVFSIEGDSAAYAEAVALVEALGGEYFFIEREAKPLYHAGACVVSNYLVTLLDLGIKLLAATGIPAPVASRALLPLVHGTINNVEKAGIPQALTGPIARGDITTVSKHLDCMQAQVPELVQLYAVLGSYTAPLAEAKGTITASTRIEIQALFRQELDKIEACVREGVK